MKSWSNLIYFTGVQYFALLIIASTRICAFRLHSKFANSKLYSVDVGLTKIEGMVVAFGDFNADKYTDLFVLSPDQQTVSVYLWNHEQWTFTKCPTANITQNPQNTFSIVNIIPGDWNYDGKLDLLLMGQYDPTSAEDGELLMKVYLGNGNDSFDPNWINIISAQPPQPMPLDATGDMKTDLLGYDWNSDSSKLSLWTNVANPNEPIGETGLFKVSYADKIFANSDIEKVCVWSKPHSNAFVDLNGDCLADLFFTCEESNGQKSYQIFVNNKNNGFEFSQSGPLPDGMGQITFADMDGDGTTDMIFPVCQSGSCFIHIAYNQQIPLCTKPYDPSSLPGDCRDVSNLCIADQNFNFSTEEHPDNGAYVIFPLDAILEEGEQLLMEDNAFKGILPQSVRAGDYNLDGYPDLLIISSSSGWVSTTSHVSLLESATCTPSTCSQAAVTANRRTFQKVVDGTYDLSVAITTARSAAFMDLDEDGTLDILVQTTTGSSDTSSGVQMIHNNYFNDAFFLKGLVLNGVCTAYCPTEPKFPDPKPYGVSYPGATYKFTVLDTSGKKRANQVSQLSQAAYLSMQTPYELWGLGRTNNYVEELYAGTTRHQELHYTKFEGVIPNSQLVFIPYQPADVYDPSTWKFELYIRPGDYVPWVMVVLISASVLLGLLVIILNWMEKREDEIERRKALHIINFDAL